MLFDKDTDLSAMKKKIIAAGVEAFGADVKKWKRKVKLPWRDGEEKADFDGYAGCIYCAAKSYNRPIVIDIDKNKVEVESDVYGGCYARAVVVAKATEAGGNHFITLYLQAVQKVKDGQPFGSNVDIEEDFSDDTLPDFDEDDPENYEEEEEEDDEFGF
jgi:hypothetical protein